VCRLGIEDVGEDGSDESAFDSDVSSDNEEKERNELSVDGSTLGESSVLSSGVKKSPSAGTRSSKGRDEGTRSSKCRDEETRSSKGRDETNLEDQCEKNHGMATVLKDDADLMKVEFEVRI